VAGFAGEQPEVPVREVLEHRRQHDQDPCLSRVGGVEPGQVDQGATRGRTDAPPLGAAMPEIMVEAADEALAVNGRGDVRMNAAV